MCKGIARNAMNLWMEYKKKSQNNEVEVKKRKKGIFNVKQNATKQMMKINLFIKRVNLSLPLPLLNIFSLLSGFFKFTLQYLMMNPLNYEKGFFSSIHCLFRRRNKNTNFDPFFRFFAFHDLFDHSTWSLQHIYILNKQW